MSASANHGPNHGPNHAPNHAPNHRPKKRSAIIAVIMPASHDARDTTTAT